MHDKKVKLLIVTGPLLPDGVGRFAQELINHVSRQANYELTVLATQKKENLPTADNVKLIRIPDLYLIKSIKDLWHYTTTLHRYAKLHDLVYFATDYPNYLLTVFLFKTPYLLTAHGTYALRIGGRISGIKTYLVKKGFKKASRVRAVSRYTAGKLKEAVPECQTVVINPALDFSYFKEQPGKDKSWPEKFIFSAGQLKARKGLHISIEAFGRIAKEFSDVFYLVAGSTSNSKYVNELKGLIIKHQLDGRVKILGHVTELQLQQLFDHCLLYIQTSINQGNIFEGYGKVFLEAGAYKKPVIGTCGSGLKMQLFTIRPDCWSSSLT